MIKSAFCWTTIAFINMPPLPELSPKCWPLSELILQTKLLTQYILNLGKYDQNYDIRDRTRFIRQLIVPSERSGNLNKYARRILLAPKPAPVLESTFKGSSNTAMDAWRYYPCFRKALNPGKLALRLSKICKADAGGSLCYSGVRVPLKGSQVGPLYLQLMGWVNYWDNANPFFRRSDGEKISLHQFAASPPSLTKGTKKTQPSTTLTFRSSLHLLDVYGKC